MDIKGNMKITPNYSVGFEFLDGIAAVENQNGKLGYITKEGKIAVEFIFDDLLPLSEGGATVWIGIKKGEVDRKGKVIIEPK